MQENKIIAKKKNANRENMRHYLLKLGYQICGGCSYIYNFQVRNLDTSLIFAQKRSFHFTEPIANANANVSFFRLNR